MSRGQGRGLNGNRRIALSSVHTPLLPMLTIPLPPFVVHARYHRYPG